MTEAEYRAGMLASSPVPRVAQTYPPSPEAVAQVRQRNSLWNSPSGRHQTGRAGALAPRQNYRARYDKRAGRV